MSKTFEQGRDEVAKLCQYFATNRNAFLAAGVKEAHIRQNLIDPFFEALGWDVANRAMVAPQYREVIPEDSLDVEGAQKAPDYTFRVGPLPKFYAEAKKCGVNVRTDPAPAYQLRRYGWSAKVAVSILTDFEELAVYDCTTRPRESDKASRARILFFAYQEYADRWRELWDVFSREAVWSGAFDQYAASKRKRGTSEVDVEFLKEIEQWRESLARNMALRNAELSSDDLNAAVQLTIDRVVFLRMAEDRGLEPYEQLLKLSERADIYARFMRELCRKADEKYNSGLFHFQKEQGVSEVPDRVTPKLTVDDRVFKPILQGLYFAHGSPYHFGVMPVEILGTVYERFLGKVIRLTAGHQAKIEEKPEVRKAGGVYYTPAYIVDYIVKQTVGKQIEGCSPAQLVGTKGKPPLRVLDMACGSGSFLLGAYQCLLDHCLRWYIEHKPGSHKRGVYEDPRDKQWRLTIEEKKRILTTHIFGVDIDPQAVEVTKLSLLLKALEGENDATLALQLRLFHERALPNLADNIKCGNSLVGPDYFVGTLVSDLGDLNRIRPFDWKSEFPVVLRDGGFDAVIGNPPYIDSELMTTYWKTTREYCVQRYHAASGNWDIFCVFCEQAAHVLRGHGVVGMIVPNKLGSADYASGARDVLCVQSTLRRVRDYSRVPVFPVAVYPIVFVVEKCSPNLSRAKVVYERMICDQGGAIRVGEKHELRYDRCFSSPQLPWNIFGDIAGTHIVEKIRAFPRLSEVATVVGAATVSEAYQIQSLILEGTRDDARLRFVNSGTIDRYSILWGFRPCRYLGRSLNYPILTPTTERNLPANRRRQGRMPKIIVAGMTKRLECVADVEGRYLAGKSTTVVFSEHDLRLILGILNSSLVAYFYAQEFGGNRLQGGYLRIGPPQLRNVPVPISTTPAQGGRVARQVVEAVDRLQQQSIQLFTARTEQERKVLERRALQTDAAIDRLVYELYGLTESEIAVVEGSVNAEGTLAN
ncbi:MAG: Eco57I restriction-modification methylase domain-containing protein [Pirellulales bacterium]|nr:Eco57I restriction-modification methylase domain-containing protein [Pirellulales bacterium]